MRLGRQQELGVDGRRHQQGELRLEEDRGREGQKGSNGKGAGGDSTNWGLMGGDTRKGSEGMGKDSRRETTEGRLRRGVRRGEAGETSGTGVDGRRYQQGE